MGQSLETIDELRSVVYQIEVDSRMFFTVERGDTRLKVWYDDNIRTRGTGGGASEQQVQMRRQIIFDLSHCETAQVGGEILSFRLQKRPLNSVQLAPVLLIALTRTGVCLLGENLMDSEMSFNCLWKY